MNKKINLGCGQKILKDFINIDFIKFDGVDKIIDLNKFPYKGLKKNYYDFILAENILEHLDYPDLVLQELYELLKNKGILKIVVPYFNSANAYMAGHKHFFSRNSFYRYSQDYNEKSLDAPKNFKLKKINLIPTRLGKFFPKFWNIRYYASLIFGEIIKEIEVTFQKDENIKI